jgi:hypothetical protein
MQAPPIGEAKRDELHPSLRQKGYEYWRRSLGDGSCFYWAFMYGLFAFPDTAAQWKRNMERYVLGVNKSMVKEFPTAKTRFTDQSQYATLLNQLRAMIAGYVVDRMLMDDAYKMGIFAIADLRGVNNLTKYLQKHLLEKKACTDAPFVQAAANLFNVMIHVERTENMELLQPIHTTPENQMTDAGRVIYVWNKEEGHYEVLEPPRGAIMISPPSSTSTSPVKQPQVTAAKYMEIRALFGQVFSQSTPKFRQMLTEQVVGPINEAKSRGKSYRYLSVFILEHLLNLMVYKGGFSSVDPLFIQTQEEYEKIQQP